MPLIKSFRPGRNIYCHSERNVLIRAKQCISYQTKIIIIKCFVRDERNSTISNISSGYDIIYSVFGTRNFYETIYFVFHFVITQHIKNPCEICRFPSRSNSQTKRAGVKLSRCYTLLIGYAYRWRFAESMTDGALWRCSVDRASSTIHMKDGDNSIQVLTHNERNVSTCTQ